MNNLKVAFDCQNTLIGRDSVKVVKLFKWFESKGCQMFIWSHGFYMDEARELHGLSAQLLSKIGYDLDSEKQEMDIAVDDNGWFRKDKIPALSTDTLLDVYKIPEDESKFQETYGHLLGE